MLLLHTQPETTHRRRGETTTSSTARGVCSLVKELHLPKECHALRRNSVTHGINDDCLVHGRTHIDAATTTATASFYPVRIKNQSTLDHEHTQPNDQHTPSNNSNERHYNKLQHYHYLFTLCYNPTLLLLHAIYCNATNYTTTSS